MPTGGGGGGQSTTTQKSDPWSDQQPYLKQVFEEAQRLYGTGVGGSSAPTYDYDKYNSALKDWQTTSQQAKTPNYGKGSNYEGGATGGSTSPMPLLEQYLIPGKAGGEKNSLLAPDYYPGQTIAEQSPETLQAQNMTTERAVNGSQVMNQAKDYTTGLLAGNYLNPDSNPYLKGYADQALNAVKGKVNSSFAGGGRYGGGINQQVLTRELGNTANNIYGQAYETERNRQNQGLLFAPTLAANDYTDLSALSAIGGAKDMRAQDYVNEDIKKYNYNAGLPLEALGNYAGLVSGNYGGTTTSTTPYHGGGGLANSLGILGLAGSGIMNGGAGLLGSVFGGAGGATGGFNSLGQGIGFFGSGSGAYGPFQPPFGY